MYVASITKSTVTSNFLIRFPYFRTFRIYDDDRSNSLSFEEFAKGLHDYGVSGLTQDETMGLFRYFDKDGGGTINFDEFMRAIRVSRISLDLIFKINF
jgi:Ca2+-binding EF-hand superfamily protein